MFLQRIPFGDYKMGSYLSSWIYRKPEVPEREPTPEKKLKKEIQDEDISVCEFSWVVHASSITIERGVSLVDLGRSLIRRKVESRPQSSGPVPYFRRTVEKKYSEYVYRCAQTYVDFPVCFTVTLRFVVKGYVYPVSQLKFGISKNGPSDDFAETVPIGFYVCNAYISPPSTPCIDNRVAAIQDAFAKAAACGHLTYRLYSTYLTRAILGNDPKDFAATALIPSDDDSGVSPDYIEYIKPIRVLMSTHPEHARHYGTAIALLQRLN